MECGGWEAAEWEIVARAGAEGGGSSLRRERIFDILGVLFEQSL
jgi:hypothetical protein